MSLDLSVILFFQNFANPLFNVISIFFALFFTFWASSACFAAAYLANRSRHLFSAVLAVLGANLIVFIIKEIVQRSRPALGLLATPLTFAGGFAYPSGHTATAFAAAVLLSYYFPKYGKLFYPVAVLVGLSRIYLGVHYPTDVIAGAMVGTISAIAVLNLKKQVMALEKKVNKCASSVL